MCEAPAGPHAGLVLMTPCTAMNVCGPSVRSAMAAMRVQRAGLVVVHDGESRWWWSARTHTGAARARQTWNAIWGRCHPRPAGAPSACVCGSVSVLV